MLISLFIVISSNGAIRVKVFVPMALNVRAAFMFAMAYFVMPESEIGC